MSQAGNEVSKENPWKLPIRPEYLVKVLAARSADLDANLEARTDEELAAIANQCGGAASCANDSAELLGRLLASADPEELRDGDLRRAGWAVSFLVELARSLGDFGSDAACLRNEPGGRALRAYRQGAVA